MHTPLHMHIHAHTHMVTPAHTIASPPPAHSRRARAAPLPSLSPPLPHRSVPRLSPPFPLPTPGRRRGRAPIACGVGGPWGGRILPSRVCDPIPNRSGVLCPAPCSVTPRREPRRKSGVLPLRAGVPRHLCDEFCPTSGACEALGASGASDTHP